LPHGTDSNSADAMDPGPLVRIGAPSGRMDRTRPFAGKASKPELTIAVEPKFDFDAPEYRELYQRSVATAFQAPLWMKAIHDHLVPQLRAEQHTLTIRDAASGELMVVMPLVLQRAAGLILVEPADFGVCDSNSIVGERAVLEALAEDRNALRRINALIKRGSLVLFRKVRSDGFDASRLFRRVSVTPNEASAFHTERGASIADWQAALPHKLTNKLGQLARKMEREHGPYLHRAVHEEADIRAAFALLKRARAGRFERDILDNPIYFDFYLGYALAAAKSGEAILYVSTVDGRPAAMLFGLAGDGIFHAVLIGADTATFGKFSVGRQLYYQAILKQFELGRSRLDLSLGDSDYKADFRVVETTLSNFTSALSFPGAAAAFVYNHAKPLKNVLRDHVPHVR
jgi:CelD/BcsL family acetyltransferase involved in cellulose biosynthesis